jgi:predicted metal-dependent enzyme (double-stranded beta helix superfamily)
LEAAIPAGARFGEMIVYRCNELTLMYARVPPHFQSGIHDHTVCACIGQLTGEERSVVYEPNEDGKGLRVKETLVSRPGEVTPLEKDAIHHIENPTDGISSALHIYAGDFGALSDRRSLYSYGEHERNGFSFEGLLAESVVAMKKSGNDKGLDGLVQAIPAASKLVESVSA